MTPEEKARQLIDVITFLQKTVHDYIAYLGMKSVQRLVVLVKRRFVDQRPLTQVYQLYRFGRSFSAFMVYP